ncbi:hypothetical protein skT53_19520 [Effusibacillus dendaii]|uniref:Aconitase A/isopropylmalate dehydratase small subunit swivel domain-containing protein n=2 Tax=Effusibacillus dendaii TaxID=2743772 RepID=A0A7I8DAF5_9BACL|nr:hypothetical protein skT53_19520 [Effusibacillus dendaii]
MIAIGAGGLDVAVAMAGSPFYLAMPKVVKVERKRTLQPWVAAKDIILEVLRRMTVKGGVGGANYGQGSSREHAALAPMYLGVKAVIAKSFARIHRANLVNFGIIPLTFANESDFDAIDQGDELKIENLRDQILGGNSITVQNVTKGTQVTVKHDLTKRQSEILVAGGLLNYTKQQAG